MNQNDLAAQIYMRNAMARQPEFKPAKLRPAKPDKAKRHEMQLQAEVEDMKRQRNKDLEDIKMLKIEMSKLDILFRKYKELPPAPGSAPIQVNLPALILAA